MKAISLWQPWASLLLSGRKHHETRGWSTNYRGLIYIHAAKRNISERDVPLPLRNICEVEFGGHFWRELPLGAVIGIGRLVACHRTEERTPASMDDRHCGDWEFGRFAWEMTDIVPIGPWPYRGAQGLFNIDDLDAVANRELGISEGKS